MRFRHKKVRDNVIVSKVGLNNVAIYLDKKLHQLADYLQGKTNGLSMKTKRISFFFFCLVFGSFSIGILSKGFFHNKTSVAIHSITFPAYAGKSSDDLRTNTNIISQLEFQHIEAFKQYMDSLKHSEYGGFLFDSVMSARPHLMDSILFLEQVYQLQSLKK